MPLVPQEAEIPLNGGLDTKRDVDRNDPQTSAEIVKDLRFNRLGELARRPADKDAKAISVKLNRGAGAEAAYPDQADPSGGQASTVFARGAEPCALTTHLGVAWSVPQHGSLASIGAQVEDISTAPLPKIGFAPCAASVARSIVASVTTADTGQGITGTACAVYSANGNSTLVVAWGAQGLSSTTHTLFMRAYDVRTGAVVASAEYHSLAVAQWSIRACPSAALGGVVVTYVIGGAAPYQINASFYDASTLAFEGITSPTANARYLDHAIIESANGYKIAYTDNGLGNLRALDRTKTATVTTHVGTHGSGRVAWGNQTRIFSTTVGAAFSLYSETYGTPGSAAVVFTAAGTEYPISLVAGQDNISGSAYAALVGVHDTTAPTAALGPSTPFCVQTVACSVTSAHALAGTAVRFPWVVPMGAATVAHNGYSRTHAVFATPLRDALGGFSREMCSLVVARVAFTAYSGVARLDPVARVAHDRAFVSPYTLYSLGCGPALGMDVADDNGAVDSDRMWLAVPIDASEDGAADFSSYPMATSVAVCSVDTTPRPVPSIERGGVATLSAGLLVDWPGELATEAQPLHTPFVVALENGAGAINGAIKFLAIYRWTDKQGNLHRSAPSAPVAISPVNKRIDVYVPIPPFSGLDATDTPVEAELYITAIGGSTYYLANTAGGAKFAGARATVGNFTWFYWQDIAAGNSANPVIYSDGSATQELVSEPPPAMHSLAIVGDRAWGVDAEDRSRIWFSKPFAAGYAIEWNVACTLTIGDNGVAVADVGGTPTIFGERGIWQVFGEGPNALGVGSFAPARRLPHEVSCISPLVAKTPIGVAFRSRRGVMLLGVGGDLQPIGRPVERALKVAEPVAASWRQRLVYDEPNDELRCIDSELGVFTYSFAHGRWTEWTQTLGVVKMADAAQVAGRVWYAHQEASSDWELRSEKLPDEAGATLTAHGYTYRTPWVHLGGTAGGIRVWRVVVTLRASADADLTNVDSLRISYHTREGDVENFTWDGTALDAARAAQTSDNEGLIEFVIRPQHQRCTAFRLEIAEFETAATLGTQPVSARVQYGIDPKHAQRQGPDGVRGPTIPA